MTFPSIPGTIQRGERSPTAWLRGALVIVLAVAGAGRARGEDRPSWSELDGRLKKAVLTKQFTEAKAVVSELAATGELKGYEIILKYAVAGHSHQLDLYAGAILARVKDPVVRKEIISTSRQSRRLETRIILLAVLARWPDDPGAMAALHDAIGAAGPYKPVAFAALRWIRKIGRPSLSVERLIDELAKRERTIRDRVYFDILDTLKKLTNQDLELAVDWKNFWKGQKEGIVRPPKRSTGVTVLAKRPSFFTVTVDSDRVYFLIDVSYSMNIDDLIPVVATEDADDGSQGRTVVKKPGETAPPDGGMRKVKRIERVKAELIRTIQGLPEYVRFGIMSFSHERHYYDGGKMLTMATPTNKERAIRWVQALTPNGATRTDAALQEALQTPEVDTVYLLTDGAPKTEQNQRIPPEQVYAVVDALNRFRKVRIHTIGFSQAGMTMRRFVQVLAEKNDGTCVLLD